MNLRRQVAVLALAATQGCSPTFNWRETRVDDGRLVAMLPCKPEHASRPVSLMGPGQPEVPLAMSGCEAGGLTFAVAVLTVTSEAGARDALQLWTQAASRQIQATAAAQQPYAVRQAKGGPVGGVMVVARGTKPGGESVQAQWLYFTRASRVYQAVILGPRIDAQTGETYFSGLILQ